MRISDWSSDVCSSDLVRGKHERRLQRLSILAHEIQDTALAERILSKLRIEFTEPPGMIQFSIRDPYLFRALAALCREGDGSPVRRQERRIEYVPVALVLLAQQPGFARFGIDANKPASDRKSTRLNSSH